MDGNVERPPPLEIFLTAGVRRPEAILWTLIEGIAALWSHLVVISIATGCLLIWKGWGGPVVALVSGGASLIWWAAIVFCWSLLMAMATGHQMSVLVTLTALFFVLGPLLADVQHTGRPLIAILTMVVPPIQSMVDWTSAACLGITRPEMPLTPTVITPITCLSG